VTHENFAKHDQIRMVSHTQIRHAIESHTLGASMATVYLIQIG
jgi:hypothetical protein